LETENVRVDFAVLAFRPAKLTDQIPPVARLPAEKVTKYEGGGSGTQRTPSVIPAPATENPPSGGLARYPVTLPNWYV